LARGSLFTETTVAIDGSKFKAANNCDKNFTSAKMERRMAQIEEIVARYLPQLDGADWQEPRRAHNQYDPLMPRLGLDCTGIRAGYNAAARHIARSYSSPVVVRRLMSGAPNATTPEQRWAPRSASDPSDV
jgi:hypothetical protein